MTTRVNQAESFNPQPPSIHPLVWAIQLWVIASLSSLVLAVGVSRALRGAFVGAELWIARVDHSAALISQVAAICTTLLLIYMGMLSARASRSTLLGIGATLLGAAPTLIVLLAHREALPQAHNWISSFCAAFAIIVCASQARSNAAFRSIIALGGFALFGAALRSGGFNGRGSDLLTEVGEMLQGFFAWCTLSAALGYHLWKKRHEPWRGAILFGIAILLFASVSASTEPQVDRWILLVGRTLGEISPLRVLGQLGPLATSGALMLVISTLFSRPGSLGQLVCALFALASVTRASPLVIGWMTLCAYCCVVICWAPLESSSPGGAHT